MAPPVKLVIFSPSLQSGGQERYISILCNNINTHTFETSLYVMNNEAQFFPITNKNITVTDLKIKKVRNSIPKILSIAKKEKPDIILVTGHHLNIYFSIFRRFFGKKLKIIARESTFVSKDNSMRRFPFIINLLDKYFYNNIDFILCLSKAMQQDLVENYNIDRQKTIVIPNFVEDVPYTLKNDTKHNEGYTFASVARLSKEKGILRILKALLKIKVPYKYYIFGNGVERKAIENFINEYNLQEKVFLVGVQKNPLDSIGKIDLFLMGSYYEGFPNVLLEAGIRGIPIVAFDSYGGSNEIIIPDFNGLVAKDETAFAFALEKALAMDFDPEKIRKNIIDKFSIKTIMSQVEALFFNLAGKK